MKEVKLNNIPGYRFDILSKYPETFDFTSTRIGGVSKRNFAKLNIGLHVYDNLEKVLKNREILAKSLKIDPQNLTCGEQVHSTNIKIVTECDKGRGAGEWKNGFPETDGLITNVRDIPLMVVTADCAAVSYFDPVNEVIGLAHSGKKGTLEGINPKLIETMKKEFGTDPKDLIVGVGPCIYPCCYEIDLPNLIRNQLLDSGIQEENIEVSGLCTFCNSNVFYSHRKENGQTGRFANILMLK